MKREPDRKAVWRLMMKVKKIRQMMTAAVLCGVLALGTGNRAYAENMEVQPAAGETGGGEENPSETGGSTGVDDGGNPGGGSVENPAEGNGGTSGGEGDGTGAGGYVDDGETSGGRGYENESGWYGGYTGDWSGGNAETWSQGGVGTGNAGEDKSGKDSGETPLEAEDLGQDDGKPQVKLKEDSKHRTSLKFDEVNGFDGTFSLKCITKEKNVIKVQFSVWNDGDSYPFTYTAFRRGKGKYQVTGNVRRHDFFSGSYHAKALVYTEAADGTVTAVQSKQADREILLGEMLYSKLDFGKKRREICLVGVQDAKQVEFCTRCEKMISRNAAGIETAEPEKAGAAAGSPASEMVDRGDDGVWRVTVDRDSFPSDGLYLTEAYAVSGTEKTLIGSTRYYLQDSDRGSVEVPEILQLPELPTGCEAVSLTIVLQSLGFSLDKTTIAEEYLPYGDNMACSYVGSPFSEEGAGIYPPGIVKAANAYLNDRKSDWKAVDVSGASMDELYGYIDQGLPVMVWHSMYMTPVEIEGESSTFGGKTYPWYITEHCVVLCGYDKTDETVTVSDPLEGMVIRNAAAFEEIYQDVGQYAVVIKK